jgi:N-acetylglucosamine-6-sulfatase
MRRNVRPLEDLPPGKPALAEAFALRAAHPSSKAMLGPLHTATQEEVRLRAAMMASVDEGVGRLLEALEEGRQLDDTCIVFLGDNGFFFGEHGLGAERRFAYEEGIRTPFFIRYPRRVKPGSAPEGIALAIDIAPMLLELAGARPRAHVQGRSLLPLVGGRARAGRRAFLIEYFSDSAFPWLVAMGYKAVRTERYKLIHWVHKEGADELYDLARDPYEMSNLIADPAYAQTRRKLAAELRRLVAASVGL